MRLAVVVPAYNAAHVVHKTVPAMLAQREPAQWTFVNDGSTDGTAAAIQRLIEQADLPAGATAEVVSLDQNRGRAGARAAGIERSGEADVLVMVDVDAAPCPGFLSDHAEAHRTGAIAAISTIRYPDVAPGEPYGRYLKDSVRGPGAVGRGEPVPWRHFLTAACSVQLEAFRQAGGFDTDITYGEDLDLATRLAASHPNGLRLAGCIDLFDNRDLAGALRVMREFGEHNLPLLTRRNPDVVRVGRLERLVSNDLRHRSLRAALRPAAALARLALPALPAAAQPRAVRVLLAAELAAAYQSGIRQLDEQA